MHKVLENKKVILFDIGYTLDYPESGDWFFTKKFLEIAGSKLGDICEEKVREARKIAMDYLDKNHLVNGLAQEKLQYMHYYSDISRVLDLGLTEMEIEEIALDRTFNMDNYIPYPNIKSVVELLSKTYKLGVISDTWPSASKQLASLGIADYFSSFTFSCDLGVFKPHEGMYLDALEKQHCRPEEAVFIDDVIDNLDGAAKVGITPILISWGKVPETQADVETIMSLGELL